MSENSFLTQTGPQQALVPKTLDLEECPEDAIVAPEEPQAETFHKKQPPVSKSFKERSFLTTLLRFQRQPISPDCYQPLNSRNDHDQQNHAGKYPQPHETQRPRGGTEEDVEDPEKRKTFVLKTYATLLPMLVVTIVIATVCIIEKSTKTVLLGRCHLVIFSASATVSFLTITALLCIPGTRRKLPYNLVLLAVLAIAQGFLVGLLADFLLPMTTTFLAFGLVLALAVFVTLVAIILPLDATGRAGRIFVLLLQLLAVVGFLVLIASLSLDMVELLIPLAVVLFVSFSVFLLFDTQRLLGGRTLQMHTDDYVLGAIILYFDIVPLFFPLLLLWTLCQWFLE